MSQEEDFARAVMDVRNGLSRTFNEAVNIHGPAVAMSAVTMFVATAVHQAEHLISAAQARQIVLGQFLSHFHMYLAHINQECDDQEDFVHRPPEGQA